MIEMDWEAFFEVHKDLPREGPGFWRDPKWACRIAEIPKNAQICDAGAGPGRDVEQLRKAAPDGHVLAIDLVQAFVDRGKADFADDPGVSFEPGDMSKLPQHPRAPFDMIWCAGALYFLGLEDGLSTMAAALKPKGVLAFSEPCYFTDTPSDDAKKFWEGYETRSESDIAAAVADGGFDVLGARKVADKGWEAYYQPMEERITKLRPDADKRLSKMLDLCATEALTWRRIKDETGYLLVVARKR